MKKDDHYLLGSLLKTTGVKGEIILKFDNELSEEILKLESILVEVDGKLVPFFIEKIKIKSTQTAVIQIEGLTSEEKSKEFIGSSFYIDKEKGKLLIDDYNEYIELKGYKIKDQNNKFIGILSQIIEIAQNPLISVDTETGEVLIPANEDFIIKIDDENQVIFMEIPKGLLDIN